MQLTAYIRQRINASASGNSGKRTMRKYEYCLRSVERYLESSDNADVGLLALTDKEFVNDYGNFLFTTLSSEYKADTLWGYFDTLRSVARMAIKDGYMPAIYIFPEVRKRLARSFPEGSGSESQEFYDTRRHPFAQEVSKLLKLIAAMAADGELKHKNKAILLYLLGMALGGLEIRELLELKADTAKLKGEATSLLKQYNGRRDTGEYLVARTGDTDIEVAKTSAMITSFMTTHGIGLMRSGSIQSDRLGLAIDRGDFDASAIGHLVRAHIKGTTDKESTAIAMRLAAEPIDRFGELQKRWYILVSYTPRLRGADMKARISQLENVEINTTRDCYDPIDEYKVKRGNRMVSRNHGAVSKLLFVRASRRDAERVDRLYPDASIMRRIGDSTTYAAVPEQEVVRMKTFLRDFRQDVQIVDDMDRWLNDRDAELVSGTRVRILNGPFAGCEGEVQRIKGIANDSEEDTRIFVITFFQNFKLVTAALNRLELEPIETR